MAHPFETRHGATVPASPEQVWDAITHGPQVDSWFMGRSDVEPREGGVARWENPGFSMESTVTSWEPPTRFAFRSPDGPGGGFHVFDYRVEPATDGATVRWIHSGALSGEDWEAEYTAMGEGDPMYFGKLVEYLTYFRGLIATSVEAFGPNLGAGLTAERYLEPLGLSAMPGIDERVRLTPAGLEPIEGVVDASSRSFLGVRTDDAMFRFIAGYEGTTMVGHHLFAEGIDGPAASKAWAGWLARSFS
jgi:uncharacterized protein YndB with AHSA1/START domain